MNYTSTRYDGPFGGRSVSGNGPGGPAGARPRPTHSASSSISSNDGKGGSYNGQGGQSGHEASGSNGSSSHHGYDSSGDFNVNDRFGVGPAGPSGRIGGAAPPGRSVGMQNISQGLREQASANYHHQQQHRRAQNSQDYENSAQYAPYSNSTRDNSQNGLTPSTARQDRDFEGDSSFDYLLSPALAPVGPISQSNSLPPSQIPLAPPPNHPPPAAPMNSSYGLGRPTFSRSQTAMPASSSSGRAYQAPAYQHQTQQAQYDSEAVPNTLSSHAPASSGQGSNSQRDYTPPPAISASALLEMVTKMRGGPSAPAFTSQAMASSSMSRSQSANAGGRIPAGQSAGMSSAHNRNISNGSNRSDDEPGSASGNNNAGGLQPPQHPGLARTTSSKNVIETSATPAGSGLETVVLSHQRVAEVPDEVIEVLAGTVNRLALSYNYIVNLPPAFAKLGGTLRYLNIRLNMFTTFPPVLCEMPSLEILDISRNKIKRLPAQCGTLKNLRVFSISKNRVKRLPIYFADMKILKVLKIDHNPLEWPPREIVTQPSVGASIDIPAGKREGESVSKLDEAQALQRWLGGLQEWIREHAHEAPAPSAMQASNSEEALPRDRSASDLRNNEYQQRGPPSMPLPLPAAGNQSQQSPVANSGTSPSTGTGPSYDASPTLDLDAARMSQHGRNASHSLATAAAQSKRGLRPKKSLPDLRQNHAQILDERFNDGDLTIDEEPIPLSASQSGRPRPTFKHTKSTSSSSGSAITPRPSAGLPTPPRSASSDRKHQLSIPNPNSVGSDDTERGDGLPPLRNAQQNQFSRSPRRNWNGPGNNNSQVSTERGSSGAYFRRLSMLPAFTISKAVPPSLLQFIDAIRGILFCLSQVHASIKQCVVFPAPDRLPANLSKLMASGEDAMGFLVDSLDRFDSNTRRGSPEVAVVKDVLETCRENVSTFGKLVQVLAEQIKTLFGPATDVRYTRTLIVSVYGAMGEIATSWAALTPLREEITSWMKGDMESSPTGLQLQPPTPSPRDERGPFFSDVPELSASSNRPLPSPALAPTGTPINMQRQAALASARRHAGSFTNYNRGQ